MKKYLLLFSLLMAVSPLFAQRIKSKDVAVEDVVSLLRETGYDLYSFDLNDFMKVYLMENN